MNNYSNKNKNKILNKTDIFKYKTIDINRKENFI